MAGVQSGTLRTDSNVIDTSVQTQRRRRRLLWCVVLVSFGVAYLLAPCALGWIGSWLNVGERLDTPVDYVYVLGGEASTRPFLAASVYRAGYTRAVLIPEGNQTAPGDEEMSLPEHDLQRAVLLNRGVPAEAISLLPGPVDSTADEAQALAKFLQASPQSSIAVVTSDFHTRRARLVFQRHLPQHQGRLYFVACPTDGFGPTDWWHHRDGILWYVAEYAKLVREQFR